MATLLVKKVLLTGLNPLDPAYVAATAGGDDVLNSGSVFLHFVNLIRMERKAVKPCAPFESLPAPKSRMVLPTPYGQNSIVRKCVGGGASSTIP